jgi:hypothetical protein
MIPPGRKELHIGETSGQAPPKEPEATFALLEDIPVAPHRGMRAEAAPTGVLVSVACVKAPEQYVTGIEKLGRRGG